MRKRGSEILTQAVLNVFCPTGQGGGIKPNCSPKSTGGAGASLGLTKTGKNRYEYEANGHKFVIERVSKTRSKTYDTRYGHVPGAKKPKRYSTTTYFTVRKKTGEQQSVDLTPIGNPPATLKDAKAIAQQNAV